MFGKGDEKFLCKSKKSIDWVGTFWSHAFAVQCHSEVNVKEVQTEGINPLYLLIFCLELISCEIFWAENHCQRRQCGAENHCKFWIDFKHLGCCFLSELLCKSPDSSSVKIQHSWNTPLVGSMLLFSKNINIDSDTNSRNRACGLGKTFFPPQGLHLIVWWAEPVLYQYVPHDHRIRTTRGWTPLFLPNWLNHIFACVSYSWWLPLHKRTINFKNVCLQCVEMDWIASADKWTLCVILSPWTHNWKNISW